ncbi:MAG TPA: hypothetical protein VMV53_00770 [Acidimicrobiales bacterium]|nr:hypothetical protein [Acidimicrobiales bacterium]
MALMVIGIVCLVGLLAALAAYYLLTRLDRGDSPWTRPGARTLIATTAGVIVALVIALAVVGDFRGAVAGIPDFRSLAVHPDASLHGTVAFNRLPIGTPQGIKLGCVDVVDASGVGPRQLFCEPQPKAMDAELAWRGDARLVATNRGQDHWRKIVDVATGTITIVPWVRPGEPATTLSPGPQGQTLDVSVSFGRLRLTMRRAGVTRTLLTVTVPRDYTFSQVAWSPNGKWLVVQDSAARLLVITTGARTTTRLLVDGATSPAVTNTSFTTP